MTLVVAAAAYDRYFYFPRNVDLSQIGQYLYVLELSELESSRKDGGIYLGFATAALKTDLNVFQRAYGKALARKYSNHDLEAAVYRRAEPIIAECANEVYLRTPQDQRRPICKFLSSSRAKQ